jgi:hypothetical protein
VVLTADYAPRCLLELLGSSQYYPLEAALEICEKKGLVDEQVGGRVGGGACGGGGAPGSEAEGARGPALSWARRRCMFGCAPAPRPARPTPLPPTYPPPHPTPPHPQVYILSRMGNSRQALALIIEQRRDIPRAIEFVRRQRDDDLWEALIAWALKTPETTGAGLGRLPGAGLLVSSSRSS